MLKKRFRNFRIRGFVFLFVGLRVSAGFCWVVLRQVVVYRVGFVLFRFYFFWFSGYSIYVFFKVFTGVVEVKLSCVNIWKVLFLGRSFTFYRLKQVIGFSLVEGLGRAFYLQWEVSEGSRFLQVSEKSYYMDCLCYFVNFFVYLKFCGRLFRLVDRDLIGFF